MTELKLTHAFNSPIALGADDTADTWYLWADGQLIGRIDVERDELISGNRPDNRSTRRVALRAGAISAHREDFLDSDITDVSIGGTNYGPVNIEDLDPRVLPALGWVGNRGRRLTRPSCAALPNDRRASPSHCENPWHDEGQPMTNKDRVVLQLHLISNHGFSNLVDDPEDEHEHEHNGPGTIRNHPREDRSWDLRKVLVNVTEAVE